MPGGPPIFGSLASGYARFRPAVHPLVIDRIARHIKQPIERALDVGCGAGLSTLPLSSLAAQTFGVDVAESMVRLASVTAPQSHFAIARVEALPFRAGSVNLITAAGSLNYARLDQFFPEAARVLGHGGWLVVYDFSPPALDGWYSAFLDRYPLPPDGALTLDMQRLAELTTLFRLESGEDFEIPLTLSPSFYLDYILTETNVDYAVRSGVPLEEIRAWCQETLVPVFGGQSTEVVFRGYIAYMRAS